MFRRYVFRLLIVVFRGAVECNGGCELGILVLCADYRFCFLVRLLLFQMLYHSRGLLVLSHLLCLTYLGFIVVFVLEQRQYYGII